MPLGIAMLAATPHSAAALHHLKPASSKPQYLHDPSKSSHPVAAGLLKGLTFRTKNNARTILQKCTAKVLRRKKTDKISGGLSCPETTLGYPLDHTTSPLALRAPRLSLSDLDSFKTLPDIAPSTGSSFHSANSSSPSIGLQCHSPSPSYHSPPSSASSLESHPSRNQSALTDEAKGSGFVDATNVPKTEVKLPNILPAVQDNPALHTKASVSLSIHTKASVSLSTQDSSLKTDASSSSLKKKQLKNKIKRFFKSPFERKHDSAISVPNATQYQDMENQADQQATKPDVEEESLNPWEQARAIPDEKYCRLVLRACDPLRKVKPKHVAVFNRCEGAFHHVTFVRLYRNRKFEEFVVRIPAHGTSALWSEEDRFMMEREVDLMRHVRRNTNAPVAEIFDHDTGCDNSLGRPYIVEARIPGSPAYNIWFEKGIHYDPEMALRDGDHPSNDTEKKRVNFLWSLADAMNELRKLEFDQTGTLVVQYVHGQGETSSIGSHYTWTSPQDPGRATEHTPSSTTQEFLKDPLDRCCNIEAECAQGGEDWRRNVELCRKVGIRKILDMVVSTPAFNQPAETFTICHPDLDLQNILTDEEGYVTGIIDWDGAFLAPRCMGASSVPKFLNRDWFPEEFGGLYSFPNLIWRTSHYRSIYAAAMINESQLETHPDACLITNSAIYTSAITGLVGFSAGGDVEDFISKLLKSIPRLHRIPERSYLVEIGRGLVEEECLLKQDIAAMLEPQLPEEKFFELLPSNIDNDTASTILQDEEGSVRDECRKDSGEPDMCTAAVPNKEDG
ncbi:serine threonine protein kinase protein [Stemphylium lycopersici]|nr:serine threonine protein kinase protein [Stemphylium lycopersici]